MTVEFIRNQLHDAGLHEESVNRLIDHYQDMRFYLGNGNYIEAGAHVGNFCENLANVLLDQTSEGADPHIEVGRFLDNILNGNYDTSNLPYEAYMLIPRAMRAAYGIRNNRDSVHVNLEVPVNHSDTQTAVRLCTWMLAELLRIYGSEDHLDDIADMIEELGSPMMPYIAAHDGHRLIMSRDLTLEQEILIHLHLHGRELGAGQLEEWIPDHDGHRIRSRLGNLKQARKVFYEDGTAKITPLGSQDAEEIIEEHFESGFEVDPEKTRQ